MWGGIPAFKLEEIRKYLKIDGWDVLKDEHKNYFIEKDLNLAIMSKVKIVMNVGNC